MSSAQCRAFFMGQKQTQEEYCKLLVVTQKVTYNGFGIVFCPILGKNVVFNGKGFHHLSYKPDGTPRNLSEKIHKLTLIPLAILVIKNALGIYETRDITIPKNQKKNAPMVKAKQYALVVNVGKKKPVDVRVIILEVENSQNPIFWSIMKH